MGTTATQPLKIVYGSLTIGKTNEDIYRIKDGTFEFKAERLIGNISFGVLVWGTTEATLISRCVAFESEFRDRRRSITVSTNSTTHHSYSTANKTGKNSSASCTQLNGSDCLPGMFSGLTREYHVSISVDLPPPSGTNGRTETNTHLRYKSNRERIMTIAAQYNSTSAKTALANYQADGTYYTDVLTYWSDGSTEWKLLNENWDSPDALYDVQMTVTREYEEIIRKIRIDYGSLTLGTADPYRILNGWEYHRVRANRGKISFSVRVYAADASSMKTVTDALEEGFAERRKPLKLYYNGVEQKSFLATSNIHMDSIGESTSQEGEWFGLITRDYRVSVEVDMPPKNADGITEEDVKVDFSASERLTVTITARYNSISGSSASSLYVSNFDTYCAGVLSAVGSGLSFNKISENYNTLPVVNVQISITRVYQEILFSENDGVLDDPAIRGLKVSLKIGKNFPGDFLPSGGGGGGSGAQSPGGGSVSTGATGSGSSSGGQSVQSAHPSSLSPRRLLDLVITASCPVQKATDIYTTYETKLRSYLIEYARIKSGSAIVAVIQESPSFDPSDNTINFTIEMKGAIQGSGQVVSSTQQVNQTNDEGKLIIDVWDGTPYGAFEFASKAKKIRTITETSVTIGNNPTPAFRDIQANTSGARWVKLSAADNYSTQVIGNILNGNENFNLVEHTVISVWRWVTSPSVSVSVTTG